MKTHPLTSRNWLYVALAAIVIGIIYLMPFMGAVALAALTAYMFFGTYKKMHRRMKAGPAATVTFFIAVVVVRIPIILISAFTIMQLAHLASQLTVFLGGNLSSLPSFIQNAIHSINAAAAPLTGTDAIITSQGVLEFIKTVVPALIGALTSFLTTFIGGLPMAGILLIIYIFLFFEFLVYGEKIVKNTIALSPFQPDVTRLYLARVGLMAKAMVNGQLFISFIISTLTALLLTFTLGLGDYFFLMVVAFTLLNLIPLGSGIVVFPIIVIAMLSGALWMGLLAMVLFILISNIDAIIRPKIIPRSITLTPGLTTLSVFAGIGLWGILGVVYGPIIMIIIITSVQMYLDYYNEQPKWKKAANKG